MGAYVSLPTWWRSLDQRYRLVLGRCTECGTHTFPPEGACPGCNRLDTLETVEPVGQGTVVARTTISSAAPPVFSDYEQRVGSIGVVIVELDEGAAVPGMLTDCDPGDVGRGDRVERTVRRVYTQEGVVRYGYKFRPL
jgi:hydroxymethylglutaryl-CoA synthase